MEENLKKLLTLVKEVCDDHRQYKKGVNVITTFVKPHREVELHSRFITWLLDPKNDYHGLGTLPLELFLKKIGSHFTVSSTTKVIPNASNWTEDRDMDILIYDKEQNFAIIIENKIYAKDSDKGENNGQLARYYFQVLEDVRVVDRKIEKDKNGDVKKYLNHKFQKIELFFLSLDGHEPEKKKFETKDNKDSEKKVELHIGEDDKGITLISYIDNIEPWITDVLNSDACKKNLQTTEIIQQYLDALHFVSPNIKLNQALFAKIEESLSYMQTLRTFLANHQNLVNLQPEKIEEALSNEVDEPLRASAIFLLKNHKHLYWHALAAFFDDLKRELEDKLKPLGVTKVEHSKNLAKLISNIIHQRKKEHPYLGFWHEGIWWTIQLNENSKRFMLGIDKANNATIDQNKLNRLAIDNEINNGKEEWWFIKSFEIVINPWNFLDEDLRLDAFFDLLSKPTRQGIATTYAEFVKYILIKFMSYVDSFGVYFSKDKKILEFASRYLRGTYTIPHSVEKINAYAFCNYNHLTSVEIPNSVKEIGTGAFYECKSLQEIIIPFGQKIRFSQMEGLKGLEDKIIEREP